MTERLNSGHRGGYAVGFSGELKYAERREIVQQFMDNNIKILVTTDVCTRSAFGSSKVVVVINFTLPLRRDGQMNIKHYQSRAGRAGQFGRYTCIYYNHNYIQ